PADQGHDLHTLASPEHPLGPVALGDELVVHLGGADGLGQAEPADQVRNRGMLGQFHGLAVDDALHDAWYARDFFMNAEPAPGIRDEPLPLGVLVGLWGLAATLVLGAIVWAGVRLWPERTYPTGTPEAVIASARAMLAD